MNSTTLPLADLSGNTARWDVFVCSASFEERCRSIPMNLPLQSVGRAIVCMNAESTSFVRATADDLARRLGATGVTVLSRRDPLATADAMNAALGSIQHSKPSSIAVDITTFTHEALLILLKLLEERVAAGSRLTAFYATATEYSVGDPNERKWLSRGVREVRSVLGYPGEASPGRKYHLILLPGIEFERAEELVRQFEPARVSIGVADRNDLSGSAHQGVHEHHCDKIRALSKDFETFQFRAYDIVNTRDSLVRQIDKYKSENQVVAPMNTKVSTIGAALAAKLRPGAQLCYVMPLIYNYDRYSKPGDKCHRYDGLEDLWRT